MERRLDFEIADAQIADADALSKIMNDDYRGEDGATLGWTGVAHLLQGPRIRVEDIWPLIYSNDGQLITARHRQRLVGCVYVSCRDLGIGEISLLSIRPQDQNSGMGRALLKAAEQVLVDKWGISRAVLSVLAPRPELQAWYRRRGYEETGSRRLLREDGEGYGIPAQKNLYVIEYGRQIAVS
jgi:ribosomal protein S18 acetylase RimI-like enzyme